MTPSSAGIHLSAAGVSVIFGSDDRNIPILLYWGPALSDAASEDIAATARTAVLHSAIDTPSSPTLLPGGADGWSGTPAAEWHVAGRVPSALTLVESTIDENTVTFELAESRTNACVVLHYHLHDTGVLEASADISNAGAETIDLTALRLLAPLPVHATEILDTTGYWSGERKPQRHQLNNGTWDRSNRRGRTGHDAPTLTWVGTPGFGFRTGQVWSAHLAWSGNGQVLVERLPEGFGANASVLGAGELLFPGEIRLQPGQQYATPPVYFTFSDAGIDGVSHRLHALTRSFASYPRTPRPLVLNSWEAVYLDHDRIHLAELARAAADIGVERFVLDDGWFLGRQRDDAGLGDWVVDPEVWPNGLKPFADLVHELGMQFGLWFEPEMVNPDSHLARAHPEWILADDEGVQRLWRNQQVLNLGDPDAWQHVLDQIDTVIAETGLDFIKWDHNRDLHEAVDRRSGRAGVHEQTAAVYRMLDTLLAKHPGLEIESCASGGARIDLGIAQHTQRVWGSDTIDPLERQTIQPWTRTLMPPELIGTHVGAAHAHTTGRVTSLPFRLSTALIGHAGIEWDLTKRTTDELQALRTWVSLYREYRELIRTGDVANADHVPPGTLLHGIVSADRDHALFQWVQLAASTTATPPRVAFPGLAVDRTYDVLLREEFGKAARRGRADPAWITTGAASIRGEVLAGPGIPLPALHPGEALLIDLHSVGLKDQASPLDVNVRFPPAEAARSGPMPPRLQNWTAALGERRVE